MWGPGGGGLGGVLVTEKRKAYIGNQKATAKFEEEMELLGEDAQRVRLLQLIREGACESEAFAEVLANKDSNLRLTAEHVVTRTQERSKGTDQEQTLALVAKSAELERHKKRAERRAAVTSRAPGW